MGLIYLDSCLVIYAFEDSGERGKNVRDLIGSEPSRQFAISPLVKLECLVAPMRDANLELQHHYEQGLEQFAQLPLGDDVFLRAAETRARFGIKTPDALHLAAAQIHHCEALWTNDDRLVTAAHGLAVDVFRRSR
ncbi:MAG: PIN domain-containing protein [Solirubrobacterales bacterium]